MKLLRPPLSFDLVARHLRMMDDGRLYWKIGDRRGREAGYPFVGKPNMLPRWRIKVGGRIVPRAHLVFCLTRGRWPMSQIDHIDRNPSNDHPSNLREVTDRESNRNRSGKANRKDGLASGVTYGRTRKTFRARIRVDGQMINLGSFPTEPQASDAYQEARKRYFGEFA